MGRVNPNVQLFVPANGKETRIFDFLHLVFRVVFLLWRIVNANKSCDLSVNLNLFVGTEQVFKLLAV